MLLDNNTTNTYCLHVETKKGTLTTILWVVLELQSIKRSLLLGARSRSALLTRKRRGAPVLAPPIKLECALAPAPEQ